MESSFFFPFYETLIVRNQMTGVIVWWNQEARSKVACCTLMGAKKKKDLTNQKKPAWQLHTVISQDGVKGSQPPCGFTSTKP